MPTNLHDRPAVIDWYEKLAGLLRQSNQRLLINCQGQRDWCLSILPARYIFDHFIILSNDMNFPDQYGQTVTFSKAETLLGQETDCVIYDGFNGINIDVLCMAAGLIKAGGVLILLTAEHSLQINDVYGCWQGRKSSKAYFFQYLQKYLKQSMLVIKEQQVDHFPALKKLPFSAPAKFVDKLTLSQSELFHQMNDWLVDKQKSVFILTADRGRGKSTLLGRFAQHHSGALNIIVTAASKLQVSILFEQINAPTENIQFVAADEIIRRQQQLDCLIIDEAAMLPGNMLQQCLKLSVKTIIATTTGGYEGTGQGFLIKFLAGLPAKNVIHHQLQQAVRWGMNDQLEQWMNEVLMLNCAEQSIHKESGRISIRQLSKQQLNEDYNTLRVLYALLVSAHYRTRPSDLRQLMEDESQLVFIASSGDQIIGAMLMIQEGGFDVELCHQIFMGQRRPQGHLLAQMMTAQAGFKKFAELKGLRIQRIAVDERFRLQGVGRLLVNAAEEMLGKLKLDYLGSSFSIDTAVIPFWKKMGFNLVHISAGKGRSTGRQTIAVLKSTDAQTAEIIKVSNQKISHYLPVWLLSYCSSLSWQEVYVVLQLLISKNQLSELDKDEMTAFCEGYRGFDLTQAVLQKILINELVKMQFPLSSVELLIEKILLNKDWHNLTGFYGKKEALKHIRLCLSQINDQIK